MNRQGQGLDQTMYVQHVHTQRHVRAQNGGVWGVSNTYCTYDFAVGLTYGRSLP